MTTFINTLIEGTKQGAIAAWYDLKWYIIIMGTILILALAYKALKFLYQKLFS